jgi:hypothetical protein
MSSRRRHAGRGRPRGHRQLGIVRQRVKAMQALATGGAGRLALHRGAPLQATLAALQALPGVATGRRR